MNKSRYYNPYKPEGTYVSHQDGWEEYYPIPKASQITWTDVIGAIIIITVLLFSAFLGA